MAQVNGCIIETSASLCGLIDSDGDPRKSFCLEDVTKETVDLMVENPEEKTATVFIIDKCLVLPGENKRCDFGIHSNDTGYLIEIKHKTRGYQDEVIEQFSSTAQNYREHLVSILSSRKRYCIVVNNKTSLTANSTRSLQSKLAERLLGFLLVSTRTLNLANPTQSPR